MIGYPKSAREIGFVCAGRRTMRVMDPTHVIADASFAPPHGGRVPFCRRTSCGMEVEATVQCYHLDDRVGADVGAWRSPPAEACGAVDGGNEPACAAIRVACLGDRTRARAKTRDGGWPSRWFNSVATQVMPACPSGITGAGAAIDLAIPPSMVLRHPFSSYNRGRGGGASCRWGQVSSKSGRWMRPTLPHD